MDKTDLIITGLVAALMSFCFYLHTYWSFFFAGICATFLIVINLGRIAYVLENRSKEKNWENFLDSLEKGTTPQPKFSTDLASATT